MPEKWTGNNIAQGSTDQPEDLTTYKKCEECQGSGLMPSSEETEKPFIPCTECNGKGYVKD